MRGFLFYGDNMAASGTELVAAQQGTSWDTAWPQVTPNGVGSQNLDLLQIVIQGQVGGLNTVNCVLNVDHAGVVHNPASSPTDGTRVGVFQSRLAAGDTTAHYFADAFANPSQSDILQVINPSGGNVVNYLDYLGVSH
jgi:hypothetical protein